MLRVRGCATSPKSLSWRQELVNALLIGDEVVSGTINGWKMVIVISSVTLRARGFSNRLSTKGPPLIRSFYPVRGVTICLRFNKGRSVELTSARLLTRCFCWPVNDERKAFAIRPDEIRQLLCRAPKANCVVLTNLEVWSNRFREQDFGRLRAGKRRSLNTLADDWDNSAKHKVFNGCLRRYAMRATNWTAKLSKVLDVLPKVKFAAPVSHWTKALTQDAHLLINRW